MKFPHASPRLAGWLTDFAPLNSAHSAHPCQCHPLSRSSWWSKPIKAACRRMPPHTQTDRSRANPSQSLQDLPPTSPKCNAIECRSTGAHVTWKGGKGAQDEAATYAIYAILQPQWADIGNTRTRTPKASKHPKSLPAGQAKSLPIENLWLVTNILIMRPSSGHCPSPLDWPNVGKLVWQSPAWASELLLDGNPRCWCSAKGSQRMSARDVDGCCRIMGNETKNRNRKVLSLHHP